MESLDTISIGILLGALLVLAGVLSSLIALRFGAPLLLIFLIVGMLAGESGPGGIEFDNVRVAYTVGSVALAIILFDGGLRTRVATFRSVMWPSMTLATLGVLLTAALTAPVAKWALDIGWTEAMLMGAVVASTDAAAVFFLLHTGGLRLRPRVGATLEIESATNDPVAIFLTIALVEVMLQGGAAWRTVVETLAQQAVIGAVVGFLGGRAMVLLLNRVSMAQGLHALFVTAGALVTFGIAGVLNGSGFLAVFLAGLIVGNRPTRAQKTVIVFLDAVTWLAQIVMFVLLGLLAWPQRLIGTIAPALAVALVLMLVARPVAVFLCLAPFRFPWREKLFISWVGLRGAVAIFLASIPLLVGLPNAYLFFDVAFVVVLASLMIQGWSIKYAARWLDVAFRRNDPLPRRVELDLPGQLAQELVGYTVAPNSPYLRRHLIPSWAKPTLVVRDETVLTPAEADTVREGDYVYLLAPLEKAQALDRFFVDMPPPATPDPRLLGDFFLAGDVALGALAEIYGLPVEAGETATTLTNHFATRLGRPAKIGDVLPLGSVALVAHTVDAGRVTMVGLRLLDDEEEPAPVPQDWLARSWAALRRGLALIRD
jgi:cell volume regulation protein A